ncbi:MAG: aminomethyl-transferring glycine dehydrogenase subunit GcvPA [Candidatus Thermoplasmatota archaeon]|nr:aminomethyl-transferring glycine dehydrogenase subunit GcvPA [Candidatus Thermoplasmatota archaeon]
MTCYIPNINLRREMLEELGVKDIEELFASIPTDIRISELAIPEGVSELELKKELENITESTKKRLVFIGAGCYDHYVPSAVKAVAQRAEFYSSYTPYQPELSQGILQALFEYQSIITELTGMDVANASMYDCSTAVAEAMRMAKRITNKSEIIVPKALHWEKKAVVKNYTENIGMHIKELPYSLQTGETFIEELSNLITENTAAIYLENPNFFGVLESKITEVKSIIGDRIFIVGVNPLTLGLLKVPGEYCADIVVGEGQILGNSMYYGGASLGILACRKEYVRQLPGRVVGMTNDSDGRRAFCLTLQTREQHIRREHATSNICTNETLYALNALVYIALLGSNGLRELGIKIIRSAKELVSKLNKITGIEAPLFKGYYFNEFTVKINNASEVRDSLIEKGIEFGIVLEKAFPELKDTLLCAITETHTPEDIERLVAALESVC